MTAGACAPDIERRTEYRGPLSTHHSTSIMIARLLAGVLVATVVLLLG